jgi:hypothetical protein
MHNSFGKLMGKILFAAIIIAGFIWLVYTAEGEKDGHMHADEIKVGDTLFFYRSSEIRNPFEGDTIRIDDIRKGWVLHHKIRVDDKPRTLRVEVIEHHLDMLEKK